MIKPYPDYKESNSDWLGQVPRHWQISLAKRFITVKSGDMISANDETEAGFPIIGGNGFRAFTDGWNTQGNTLVIGRVGALCGCVHHIEKDFWASEHAYRVIEKEKVDKRFFFHLLSALNLNQFAIKTAQPLLNTEIVETQWISVPPYMEQKHIGTFLDHETAKIDSLVEEQRRLIELLKEKRQAVISHAVTKGLNPNAPMKDSGIEWLGKMPEHWTIKPLKHLGTFSAGAGFPHEDQGVEGEELSFHKVNALAQADDDSYLIPSENTVSRMTADRLRAFIFPANSIVFAKIGAALLLGRIRLTNQPSCLDNNMMGFVTDASNDFKFIRYLFEQVRFDLIANPGTVPSLNEGQISNISFAIPPKSEQVEIASFLGRALAQLNELTVEAKSGIKLFQERRTALISAAVTGKIDVRNFTTKETEAA